MSIAFLSIVGLLFASGMISFLELSHLSYDTEEILKANQRNMELAKEMLGAVHDQNVAIVHLAILRVTTACAVRECSGWSTQWLRPRRGRWTARRSTP